MHSLMNASKRLLAKQIGPQLSKSCSRCSSGGLQFDGRTAIVTGAGRGLGREYAILLASRGANVVVNDYGGSKSGDPKVKSAAGSSGEKEEEGNAADLVVQHIRQQLKPRGKILANYNSIKCEKEVGQLIDETMQTFNRVDILINNAGILRDKSFHNMTIEDWDLVNEIHLRGSFLVTHKCWPIMRRQKYGKIIMTSSTSGLYGNFGQANYAAAKMGLIGLSNTLAIEGKSKNIFSNTVVPMAASRMTRDIIPEDFAKRLLPNYVAPLVVYLCHERCKTSGAIIEAAGRWFGRHRLQRSSGKYLTDVCNLSSSLEQLDENWSEICENFGPKTSQEVGSSQNSGELSFGEHLSELMKVFDENK